MARTHKGTFVPKHPEKYVGANVNNIQYRSGWEQQVFMVLDTHPNVLGWSSETVSVPYQNPLTGKWSMYIPDLLVVYLDKSGRKHCEMVEIKPLKEVPGAVILTEKGRPRRLSERDKLVQAINAAKWQAASVFCAKRGWLFRVATEKSLFNTK